MRTCSSIIEEFTRMVSERVLINPEYWMTAATYLNVLIGEEQAKLFEAEQAYTKKALFYVGEGDTNAVAEKKAKMTDEFITFKKQQAFCKQIEQFILLAKKQATITVNNGG